jgi:hypothetical protein
MVCQEENGMGLRDGDCTKEPVPEDGVSLMDDLL